MAIDSIKFTDTIWYIGVQCGETPSTIPSFNGHVDTPDITTTDLANIQHLLIGFMLYEPQVCHDFTDWVKDTLNYLHQSNMFPNLKNVYILYSSVSINFTELPDQYMVYGHQPRYFLLRSEGTEEKSIGVDYSAKWEDSLDERKALWLVGDTSNRPHKLPLLYKFFITGTIDRVDYSLTTILNPQEGFVFKEDDPIRYEHLIKCMNEVHDMKIDYEQLCKLYEKLSKTLPGDDFSKLADEGVHSFDLANYVFPKEWNDACLIIMPETWFDHPAPPHSDLGFNFRPFWEHHTYPTTEKTWKPIITKRPFMGISRFDLQERTLESMGYRTFRKYTVHPNLIEGEHSKKTYIKIAHERIISFLEHSKSYQNGIQNDIEFNYHHHKKVLKGEWDLLYQSCPPLKHVDKIKFLRLFTVPAPREIYNLPSSEWLLNR